MLVMDFFYARRRSVAFRASQRYDKTPERQATHPTFLNPQDHDLANACIGNTETTWYFLITYYNNKQE